MNWIRRIIEAIKRMFQKSNIESRMPVDVVVSDKMASAIDLWTKIYLDRPPWRFDEQGHEKIHTANLPAIISKEIARLVTIEMETEVSDDDINELYQGVIRDVRDHVVEWACAQGGVVFKLYTDGETIHVDYVQADSFYPTATDSNNNITGAVFKSSFRLGDSQFTKLEWHNWTPDKYTIVNKAYENKAVGNIENADIGNEIPLTKVDAWADIEPEVNITGATHPFFSYFRMPGANPVELNSPLGASCFASSVTLLKLADIQFDRIQWEFEATEPAIDVDETWLKRNADGKVILPKGRERLYRTYDLDEGQHIQYYTPTIRASEQILGYNQLLRRIEFNTGLSYGKISDPNDAVKTATEIISSQQRMYTTVTDIQEQLEAALRTLVDVIVEMRALYEEGAPADYEVTFKWDDSILVDSQTRLKDMKEDVASGILRPEIYIAEKYGVTEEEALQMMPDQTETEDEVTSAEGIMSGMLT